MLRRVWLTVLFRLLDFYTSVKHLPVCEPSDDGVLPIRLTPTSRAKAASEMAKAEWEALVDVRGQFSSVLFIIMPVEIWTRHSIAGI